MTAVLQQETWGERIEGDAGAVASWALAASRPGPVSTVAIDLQTVGLTLSTGGWTAVSSAADPGALR